MKKQKTVQLKEKLFKPSKTEDYCLQLIPYGTENILSIGISTGGSAEIRMAKKYHGAKITATTLDTKGLEFAKKVISKYGVTSQVRAKIEDVRKAMPYENSTFDLVYARLVLHYLTAAELENALNEIYRVLKPGGLFYLVMHDKSDKSVIKNTVEYDSESNLTTYKNEKGELAKRQFFSADEIEDIILEHNFKIAAIKHWREKLYIDFERTKEYKRKSKLFSIVAFKPKAPESIPDWE